MALGAVGDRSFGMPTIEYSLHDVFTDVAFTGNPLAVVIDPPELGDAEHRAIARELNLSETVFLRPRKDGSWDTRIFTPAAELPFAGHPTIGAALALAEAGHARGSVVLHEGVGAVPVDIVDGRATLTTPVPPTAIADVAEADDVAACLGLGVSDLHPTVGVRAWSAGVPFTMVTLREVAQLEAVAVDVALWSSTVALTAATELYVLAPVDGLDGPTWRSRMFAPGLGIAEDPATGSAAAAACGYLAGHVSPRRLEEGWTFLQGVEMGRPSEISVRAITRGAELVAATVGGRAVRVGSGRFGW